MYLRIRSYKSKGSQPNNLKIKLYEGTLYYYLIIRQFTQMELFYLHLLEASVLGTVVFRQALGSFCFRNNN
jgi:hypothetical protein